MILAYATIFGLVQIVCTWVGSQKLFAYLKERDLAQAKERRELYTRIQAPEVAIAQDIAEDAQLLEPVDSDNDSDWWRNRAERAELAGNHMPIDVPEPPQPLDDEGDLIGVS